MKTDDLIAALAADNASSARPVAATMSYAIAASVIAAFAVFAVSTTVRPDILQAMTDPRFLLKPVSMIILALGAAMAVHRLARPEAAMGWLTYVLIAVPVILLAAVAWEFSAVPAGARWSKLIGTGFIQCLSLITLIGLAPLAIILWGLRQGAPANPVQAGCLAGVAAAGIAAVLYAAHCPNDSPFYVAAWYSLATAFLAGMGAVAGPRVLRW